MKPLMAGLAACLVALLMAVPASAQISGSAHDFSDGLDRFGNPGADTWNTTGELCIVCHTPHNGTVITGAPLWNHETTTTGDFTLYSSTTLTATMEQPAGQSLLCLSCHDGTVAVDNFNGVTTGTVNIGSIDAALEVTKDLSDDHPVSFDYLGALPDAELAAAAAVQDVNGNSMLFTSGAEERVECASCHDVHNNGDPLASALLRVDNGGSDLCFTCHIK